jgi:Lrp/AsnC family transcriptional regulator for asnA, asnC and gidA
MDYEIDDLDRKILRFLQIDSRKPFLEIARELNVSGGTVHSRVNRLRQEGIIRGSKIVVDYEALGFSVLAFIGIKLAEAGSFKKIQDELESIPQIVEVHYTTGSYSLFVKIAAQNINALYELLSDKLQSIKEIQSTETFVILNTSVSRDLVL